MRVGTFVLLMALLLGLNSAFDFWHDLAGGRWVQLALDTVVIPLWIITGISFRRRIIRMERDAEAYRADKAEQERWLASVKARL